MVGILFYEYNVFVEWICSFVNGVMCVVFLMMVIGGLLVMFDVFDKLCNVGVIVCEILKLVVL